MEIQIANYNAVLSAREWNIKITTIGTAEGASDPELEDQASLHKGWSVWAEMSSYFYSA